MVLSIPWPKNVNFCGFWRRSYRNDISLNLLHRLNTSNERQLQMLRGIGTVRARKIIEQRRKYGLFETIDQVKNIQGFSNGLLDRLSKFICSNDKKKVSTYVNNKNQIKMYQGIQSIFSIDLGFKNFAYVHMDKDFNVLDWNLVSLPFISGYCLHEVHERLITMRRSFPNADIYVMEEATVIPYSGGIVKSGVPLRTIEAMLYCMLQPHPIEIINARTVQSYFKLGKGRKKKSDAVSMVHKLITGDPENSHKVICTPQQIAMFESHRKKDDLSDCLLQALTFFDLRVQNISCNNFRLAL